MSIDGLSGEVKIGQVATKPSEILQVLDGKMKPRPPTSTGASTSCSRGLDKERTLGIRANADRPTRPSWPSRSARAGIGLCRTEHMFFERDASTKVQKMILADTVKDRMTALDELLPLQRATSTASSRRCTASPVTIRFLDPPLHEFLPKHEDAEVEVARRSIGSAGRAAIHLPASSSCTSSIRCSASRRAARHHVSRDHEMQARAIFEAAAQRAQGGLKVMPEIMIPLVGFKERNGPAGGIVDPRGRASR